MAGNPSWDGTYDVNGYFDFIANHGLLNEVDYDNAMKICNGVIYPNNNQTCKDIVSQLITSNTKYINPYNIYAPCLGGGPDPHGGCFTHGSALSAGPQSQTFVPCIAIDYVVKYVNQVSSSGLISAELMIGLARSQSGVTRVTKFVPRLGRLFFAHPIRAV